MSAIKVTPNPHCNLKVIGKTWGLKIPGNRICEHPDHWIALCVLLLIGLSLYLDHIRGTQKNKIGLYFNNSHL